MLRKSAGLIFSGQQPIARATISAQTFVTRTRCGHTSDQEPSAYAIAAEDEASRLKPPQSVSHAAFYNSVTDPTNPAQIAYISPVTLHDLAVWVAATLHYLAVWVAATLHDLAVWVAAACAAACIAVARAAGTDGFISCACGISWQPHHAHDRLTASIEVKVHSHPGNLFFSEAL
jgi:hypothetical protein